MTTTQHSTDRVPATAQDPYARIATLGETEVEALADRIEVRAADPRQRRLWAQFLSRVDFAGRSVLEVGSGTGVITELIAQREGVGEVVGIDPCPGFVDRARRRAPQLRFEVADGRDLPFAAGSFDVVVLATTLCHVPGPELVLAECRRVLTAGGTLLVYDGDYATMTVAVDRIDPLQACVETVMGQIVHDPWLVRRLPLLVRAAGFTPGELRGHAHIEASDPAYALRLIALGSELLVAAGTIGPETAEALRAEADRRVREGRFHCSIDYASLVAAAS
jgi:SAM-dependent methyltransferase